MEKVLERKVWKNLSTDFWKGMLTIVRLKVKINFNHEVLCSGGVLDEEI